MVRTPLRAAMAACGGIAGLTIEAARRSPDFDLVAIQDVDADALERVGDRCGIARRHLTFGELLTDDIDFVVINGPNHVHLPQVRAAAAAGKHCLVQKPMAPDLGSALAMLDAARERGVRLGIVMFELSKPLHHEVRRMVADGWLGEPVLLQCCAAHDLYLDTPPLPDDWRRDPLRVGGGAIIQLSLHQADLACWLLDREAVSVIAKGARGHTVFEDETAMLTLEFEGGVLGHFATSYAADLWGISLLGTRGRVQVTAEHVVMKGKDAWAGEILRYRKPGREAVVPLAAVEDRIDALKDGVEVHGAFARWIRGEGEFPSPGERGVRDMRIVDAAYRSLEEGACISLD